MEMNSSLNHDLLVSALNSIDESDSDKDTVVMDKNDTIISEGEPIDVYGLHVQTIVANDSEIFQPAFVEMLSARDSSFQSEHSQDYRGTIYNR